MAQGLLMRRFKLCQIIKTMHINVVFPTKAKHAPPKEAQLTHQVTPIFQTKNARKLNQIIFVFFLEVSILLEILFSIINNGTQAKNINIVNGANQPALNSNPLMIAKTKFGIF